MKDTKIKTISPEWKNEKTETISPEIVSRLLEREERVKQLSKRLERERLERERLEKERTLDLTGEKISNGIVEKISLGKKADPVALPRIAEYATLTRDEFGNYSFAKLRPEHLSRRDIVEKVISELIKVKSEVESVNSKGYVNDINLINYPVYAGYLNAYLASAKGVTATEKAVLVGEKLKGIELSAEERLLVYGPQNGLRENSKRKELESKEKSGSKSKSKSKSKSQPELTLRETRVMIKWFTSLLNLNLFVLSMKILSDLKITEFVDLKSYLEVLSGSFYGRISPSIREGMKQKSVTITKNIYCGFDTEYENIDMKYNKLLSAQFAVNSKLLLTLPMNSPYSLSGMNTHTGEEYPINSMWFDQSKIKFDLLQESIRDYVGNIRNLRGFAASDRSLEGLIIGLQKSGKPYFVANDKITFSYPRSSVKTYFKDFGLSKLSMDVLVSIGLKIESETLDSSVYQLKSELKSLKGLNGLNVGDEDLIGDLEESNMDRLSVSASDVKEVSDVESEEFESGCTGSKSVENSVEYTGKRLNIITRRNFHLIGHLTQADLCFLSDINNLSKKLDIVSRSLVTLGDSKLVYHGYKLRINDTMLLAPGGKKSLAAIGGMYGLNKIALSEEQHQRMGLLLKNNPVLFKEYALRDAVISLIHAQSLEDANFRLHKSTIPMTLSLLGGTNLRKFWKDRGYNGYQLSKDTLLGDSRKTTTPKGLFELGDTGLALNNYIANYKGGRNESFMIGKDNGCTQWKDYDLTAAYATAMCMLGDPNYNLIRSLSAVEIQDMSDKELLYSYSMIKVNFEFGKGTLYPSIPCYADQSTTVYPLKGSALLTGSEYLLARSQFCKLEILGGTVIPYKYKSRSDWELILKGDEKQGLEATKDKKLVGKIEKLLSKVLVKPVVSKKRGVLEVKDEWALYKKRAFPPRDLFNVNSLSSLYLDLPFYDVISDLQRKRKEHLPGTINNLLYKEMGNSLYGSVAKGLSNKSKFDIKTGKSIRMEAGSLSNPIMASYITSGVRSLIGTFLEKVSLLGGAVVSVTTDGFITDVEDLETKLMTNVENLEKKVSGSPVYEAYSEIRKELSGNPLVLELKHEGQNLTSWTTRGQVSSNMRLKAATGIQTFGMSASVFENLIEEGMRSESRTVSFVGSNLRSVKDIVKSGVMSYVRVKEVDKDGNDLYKLLNKSGGHVTMQYRDQDFRILFNNNREVVGPDPERGLMQTRPWTTIDEALTARAISNVVKGSIYQRNTSLKSISKYKSLLELGVRRFLKSIFIKKYYGTMFNSYDEIIEFINNYINESGVKVRSFMTRSYISQVRMSCVEKVQAPNRFKDLLEFKELSKYVGIKYPTFEWV